MSYCTLDCEFCELLPGCEKPAAHDFKTAEPEPDVPTPTDLVQSLLHALRADHDQLRSEFDAIMAAIVRVREGGER